MGSDGKVFALEAVAKHNSKEDCWLIIGGKASFSFLHYHFSLIPTPAASPAVVLCRSPSSPTTPRGSTPSTSPLPRLHGHDTHRHVYGEDVIDNQQSVCPSLAVYNVTKFLDDHPGGDDVLLSATGKDATDDFEDVGHSSTARSMMDEYYVGEIDTATIPSKVKYTPPKQPNYNQDKTSEFVIKLLQFLVPLIILGSAVAVRIYTKSE